MNKEQLTLLRKISHKARMGIRKIPISLAEEIEESGLMLLFDIKTGYCEDDLLHGKKTFKFGNAYTVFYLSKELVLHVQGLDAFIHQEVSHQIYKFKKENGLLLKEDHIAFEYDSEKEVIEMFVIFTRAK